MSSIKCNRSAVQATRHAARVRAGLACAAALALAGCGLFGSKTPTDPDGYRSQAGHESALDVPPDLSPLGKDERFTLPEQPNSANALRSAAVGAGGGQTVAFRGAHARLMRDGAQRWLTVDVPPEKAYQSVKDYLASSGWQLGKDQAPLGIVETDWQESRASVPQGVIQRAVNLLFESVTSTGLKDQFRVRVERTPTDTSEIFVTHRGLEEVYSSNDKSTTIWQPRPRDPELEAELMQRLLLHFEGADASLAKADQSPADAGARKETGTVLPGVSHVVKAEGQSHLVVDEPFDRAWRRVGLALDRGGFTVEDRDRTKGLYFVRYIDPDYLAREKEKRNLIARVFDSDPKVEAQQFRLALLTEGDRTSVRVQNKEGQPESGPTGERILQQLDEQMR